MALSERFKGSGAEGIARFLADHQHCDAGFDVRRGDKATAGRLRITCDGCGESIDYKAGEASDPASTGVALPEPSNGIPVTTTPDAPTLEPTNGSQADADAVGAPDPPSPDAGGPTGRRPRRWIPLALIAALIAGGIGMIAIGLLRSDDGQGGDGAQPVASQPDVPATPPAAGGGEPAATGPGADTAPPADTVALNRRTFAARFSIGVPEGWSASGSADGATIEAPGSTAEVSVFFGRSDLAPLAFARRSEPFLAARHRGAEVGAPRATSFQGSRAARVRVTYRGGAELATFASIGGVVYALLRRVDRGASRPIQAEAEAAFASFRALR